MAIKIPSKNIYEINNPKIRDNMIDNVSVEQTVINPNNEYEVSVYNEKFSNVFSIGSKQDDYKSDVDGYAYIAYIAFVEAIPEYANISEIKIPIYKNNNYISKIYIGKNENSNPNIKIALIGNINKGEAYKNFYQGLSQGGITKYDTVYNPPTSIEKDKRYELPSTTIKETIKSGLYVATAEVTINDLSNILTISYKKENDCYVFNDLKILSGLKFAKLKNSVSFSDPDNWGEYQLNGTYEEYIPTQIEITIYGNTIGIDLTDGSITYGSGNKPFSLERNELLQDSANSKIVIKTDSVDVEIGGELSSAENISYLEMITTHNFNIGDIITNYDGTETAEITYYDSSNGFYEIKVTTDGYFYQNMGKNIIVKHLYCQEKRLTQHLAENVLNQYAKGKETATLLCDISDYYDESGNLVISTKNNSLPMTFKIGDIVIPYVYGADGQDYPMSKYQNGQPKQFRVCGAKKIYDGAVWQELTLQEV